LMRSARYAAAPWISMASLQRKDRLVPDQRLETHELVAGIHSVSEPLDGGDHCVCLFGGSRMALPLRFREPLGATIKPQVVVLHGLQDFELLGLGSDREELDYPKRVIEHHHRDCVAVPSVAWQRHCLM